MIQEIRDALDGTYKRRARHNAIAGIGAGLLIGAITGLLFAPKSGKETRADLREGAIIGAEKIKETAVHVAEMAREKAAEIKEQIKKGAKCCVKTAEEAAEDIQDTVEDVDSQSK